LPIHIPFPTSLSLYLLTVSFLPCDITHTFFLFSPCCLFLILLLYISLGILS
jgi:hypothetical protein